MTRPRTVTRTSVNTLLPLLKFLISRSLVTRDKVYLEVTWSGLGHCHCLLSLRLLRLDEDLTSTRPHQLLTRGGHNDLASRPH